MTVTYPLALPNIKAIRTSIRMGNRTGVSRSPFSASEQRYEWAAKWWECDIVLPPMSRAQVAEWQGFLAQLNGRKGTFLAGDPLATTQRGDIGAIAPPAGTDASLYDGITDKASWSSIPTGMSASGPGFTLSMWFRCDSAGSDDGLFGTPSNSNVLLLVRAAGYLNVNVKDTAGGTLISYLNTGPSNMKDGNWHHVILSLDRTGNKIQLVIDGITRIDSTYTTANDIAIHASGPDIGAAASNEFHGALSEIWVDDVAYDVVTNLTTWRAADGTPAGLGADGSAPGAQPVIYAPDGDPSSNLGIGGDATITGALVAVDGPTPTSTPAVPLVNGADQTGATLAIDGLQASKADVFKAGDYFQIGTGSSARLYMVTADAASNASGEATLDIWPPLRASPADNAALTITNPKGVFRLTGDVNGWDADAAGVYAVTLQAVEVV